MSENFSLAKTRYIVSVRRVLWLSFGTTTGTSSRRDQMLERFLAEMDAVVPCALLIALIEPYYPEVGNGWRPCRLEVMLRIYFLQQWYQLSDPGAEETLYDIQSMRAFAGLELGRDAIPDETTILNLHHNRCGYSRAYS